MSRAFLDYTERRASAPVQGGIPADTPIAGHYRARFVRGGIRGGVRIWFGPPHDPVTGEELDRSWRWQAEFNGAPADFDRFWPECAREPISEAQYREYVAQTEWAKQNAPKSAYASPVRRHDPLSTNSPLPF